MEMERFSGRAKADDHGAVAVERFKYQAGEEELGAVALVLDLAKALERVSLTVVWSWATHFSFPRKILRVLCRVLRVPEASAVRRMCGGGATDHHCYFARVKVELLATTHCVAGRAE